MDRQANEKTRKPYDLIRFFHEVLTQGMSPEEVTEFERKKDYANNSL
jgi:hypothetical protein